MIRADDSYPGFVVRQQCLTPNNFGVVEAARVLGFSSQALSNLVTGRAAISYELAIRLAKAFGGSDEQWMQLQLAYDLAQARRRADAIDITPIAACTTRRAKIQPERF